MLLELHVKNLALIEKADVEFGEGLNILTLARPWLQVNRSLLVP